MNLSKRKQPGSKEGTQWYFAYDIEEFFKDESELLIKFERFCRLHGFFEDNELTDEWNFLVNERAKLAGPEFI